jgi:hypothetical protein
MVGGEQDSRQLKVVMFEDASKATETILKFKQTNFYSLAVTGESIPK